ncbi:uncharacterized protein LOC116347095 [Contarinia nasturtii]|uniref:uncharacterized protein LOC116347095 n=1 Tax=Contarinia nasturtii TaxID=265458 RepID=UPI0012D46B71|nr:uncharacterized protein LOC116347095 [Contarinia nasturtii]
MQDALNNAKSYMKPSEFEKKHNEAKDKSIQKLKITTNSKLKGIFILNAISAIEKKYANFRNINNKKPKPSPDEGRMALTVSVCSANFLEKKNWCDDTTRCDPYIKIFINNKVVIESKVYEDNQYPDIKETYLTDNFIHKNTPIKIEMWDSDNGNDDRMMDWHFDPATLLNKGGSDRKVENANCIDASLVWIPKE